MDYPSRAIQYLIDTAPIYAKAKADRMYLEEFRKSKKAQLMSQAGTEVLGKQETYAYAHADYIGILEGIREAVQKEETYRWMMTAAQAKVSYWQTTQYNARMEAKVTQ
jgi:cytochrome c biogenesis protein ResB